MKLLGKKKDVLEKNGRIYFLKIVGFIDDRFRIAFAASDAHGIVKIIPVAFKRGTKEVDLDKDVWPTMHIQFQKELV